MIKKQILQVLAVLTLAGVGVSAHAASTWAFTGVSSSEGAAATTSYSSSEGTLNISSAYKAAAGSSIEAGGTLLHYSGGLGIDSDGKTSPNHAIDNVGNTEMVLLSFSKSMVLTSIGIGFNNGGDADIAVFRYTGNQAPSLNGTTATYNGLTNAGWSLVGNYADLGVDTSSPYTLVNGATVTNNVANTTASSVGSSWWLIMAYNSALTTGGSKNGGTLSNGDDYFKLFGVTTNVCGAGTDCGGKKLPEPASLALVSVALVGVVGARRRRLRTVA